MARERHQIATELLGSVHKKTVSGVHLPLGAHRKQGASSAELLD